MTTPTEYLYSTDDEHYVYTSLTDCLESMYNSGDYEDDLMYVVYRAKAVPLDIPTMCWSLAVDTINNYSDYVYGVVGETYDPRKPESKESRVALQSAIEQWVYQYTSASTRKELVGKSEQLDFTGKEVKQHLYTTLD